MSEHLFVALYLLRVIRILGTNNLDNLNPWRNCKTADDSLRESDSLQSRSNISQAHMLNLEGCYNPIIA